MLNRGPKYDVLQFTTNHKNRHKYGKTLMQKVGLKEDKEVSDACRPQTDEGPSTKFKRDLKYDLLQLMIKPKTVYKYAQNTIQDKAKKRAITQSIKRMLQTAKYP